MNSSLANLAQRILTLGLMLLTAAASSASASPKLACEVAQPRVLPPGAPKASDVMMRSLRIHPANAKDPYHTLEAAHNFHVTRLDWMPALTAEFVKEAGEQGIGVSGSTSASLPKSLGTEADAFSLRDLEGKRVCMKHKRNWGWNVEGCVNNPGYRKWYEATVREFLSMGCIGMQRDEPGANLHMVPLGGCFCPHCMAEFRRFLATNTTPAQRARLGLDPVESFDYAAHLRKLGAPAGDAFEKWEGGELKELFTRFQSDATVAFHQTMRQIANAQAKRTVAWSCNNGARRWEPPEMVFDYFIGELSISRTTPEYLHEIFCKAAQLGKAQVVTMPLTGSPIVNDDISVLARKTIATSYALGGLCMVPWDTYMPKDQPRYFGKPAVYADLYGFVRGIAKYLDGYEYAGAFSKELTCELYGKLPPVRRRTGAGAVFACVRAKPADRHAPVVLHLVDWAKEPKPLIVSLDSNCCFGDRPVTVQLLTPVAYEAAKHQAAKAQQDFSALVAQTDLNMQDKTTLSLPALSPWGVVVITPKANEK